MSGHAFLDRRKKGPREPLHAMDAAHVTGKRHLWLLYLVQSILEEHRSGVQIIILSLNCQMRAMGSNDRTVRPWDMTVGSCLSNGKIFASASNDQTVRLWDTKTAAL